MGDKATFIEVLLHHLDLHNKLMVINTQYLFNCNNKHRPFQLTELSLLPKFDSAHTTYLTFSWHTGVGGCPFSHEQGGKEATTKEEDSENFYIQYGICVCCSERRGAIQRLRHF